MNKGQPAFRLARSLTRHALARRQLADQVEYLALPLRRVGKDLLVQPFHRVGVQSFCPGLEEKEQKLVEEHLYQDFEALIVVHDKRILLATR